MKKQEWTAGLDHIDPALVEQYVHQKETLTQKKKKRSFWLRAGALAACFALILSAVVVAPLLKSGAPLIDPSSDTLPPTSVIASSNKLTGKQELIYGNYESINNGNDDQPMAPGFEIQTVVEVEVIEVLPDTYYGSALYAPTLHVAKLRVIDEICGEGFPEEIYLSYPYYDTSVLDGYECFIMSLQQVGIENYAMINQTQGRVDYFPNMFEVVMPKDLGYGSVIAFNDGKVDDSFWNKVTHFHGSSTIKSLLGWQRYPAERNGTIEQTKQKILEIALKEEYQLPCDYITVDDVFFSNEAKQIKTYIAPSETNVFLQKLHIREDRIIASYTRIINGFETDEVIHINGYTGENGNVQRRGVAYTEADLARVPNIGEAISNIQWLEVQPPHITVAEGMELCYANAKGIYRKVDGKIYGVVRILWYYQYPDVSNSCQRDDMYYLYDQDGNGSIVSRSKLKRVIGDDSFIQSFSYHGITMWD